MKARGCLLVLVCALAALVLPAAAAAKPGYVVKAKGLHLSLGLPASDGYSASLRTQGHRQVKLTLSKGSFFANYVALGRVSRKGIEADFGRFGHVSLRFRAKDRFRPPLIPGLPGIKPPPSLRDRCKGRRSTGERGVFVGSVRFEGERGYAQVHAHRLRGKVVRSYRRVCKEKFSAGASKVKARQESVIFTAQAQRFGVHRLLIGIESSLALKDEEFAFTIAFGGERRKVGRVGVRKLMLVIEDFDSIEVSPLEVRPLTAEVKLRKPFEGSASYVEKGKAPPTWTGTLGVRLPGSGLMPLAGPEFEAELCRASGEEEIDRCVESVLSTLGNSALLQGSGSHSQPLALARLSSLR
jgi:hypothetical protein